MEKSLLAGRCRWRSGLTFHESVRAKYTAATKVNHFEIASDVMPAIIGGAFCGSMSARCPIFLSNSSFRTIREMHVFLTLVIMRKKFAGNDHTERAMRTL